MPQEAENVNKATMVLAAAALSITLIPTALAAEGVQGIDELRAGSPEQTVPTPEDFPDAYDYGSGRISDSDCLSNFRHLPEPENGATVLHAEVNPGVLQVIYL